MAINKNHEFEELAGVKCAIVERNVDEGRMAFLRSLLEANGYTVMVITLPPPPAPTTEGEALPPAPERYTVGVTDLSFNPVNAVFGRLLRTRDGKVVTLQYWQQKENVSQDERPYFEER